ncbi:MAG: Na+/H+ antiporter subunit E [Deltaproteobacteria bacterium]|nr:MAG: Na+/H+ antiporter subunit E [Deltaproteobacteria bacterium]
MKVFLLNLLLALLWEALTGRTDSAALLLGFLLGYVALWWLRPLLGPTQYFRKLPESIRFTFFFLRELIHSNLRVAWDVISPQSQRKPGIVAVPLDASSDIEITFLANLITLTPGTLSLDVSADRSVLYVHGMFVEDPQLMREQIKNGFERRVLELLR